MSEDSTCSGFDPATITMQEFEPHTGSTFRLRVPDHPPVELTLIDTIDEYREAEGQPEMRRPFSLVLEAHDDVVFPQMIRELQHESLGKLEVFIIPFGIVDEKARYQIIFN